MFCCVADIAYCTSEMVYHCTHQDFDGVHSQYQDIWGGETFRLKHNVQTPRHFAVLPFICFESSLPTADQAQAVLGNLCSRKTGQLVCPTLLNA